MGDHDPSDAAVTAFVDGLLPEGDLRTNRAVHLGIDPDDTFALFHRCGYDTAGALVVTAAGEMPPAADEELGAVITPQELARRLIDAGHGRFSGSLTSISLTGLVPKIGVVRDTDGVWRLPVSGQASTWIVKQAHPDDSRIRDVVDTEALCLDLGRRCGVTDIEAELLDLGAMRAIAMRRFDRLPDGFRIHQEDLAQALGLATRDPERKFQRGRARPSWALAADVLRAGAGHLSPLARLVTFSYLVGNTDHHAKNSAFIRHQDGSVRLASAYDMAMHLHHAGPHWFALDVAGKREVIEDSIHDVRDEIVSWGVMPERACEAIADVVADLAQALDEVDRARHPGVPSMAWDVVEQRVLNAVSVLAQG